MKVSVIVPVYKAEKWLHRCVDSILAQTMIDFELLLIDDGSPDKSGEICDEYAAKDSRVRVFHKENGGVSSARNMGLDNAYGEWISFVDADDWVEVDYLAGLTENLDADFILGGFKILDNQQSNLLDYKYEKSEIKDCIERYLFDTVLLSPWGNLLRNDILQNNHIRFDEKIHYAEDRVFNRQYILCCNEIRTISFYSYNYIVDGSVIGYVEKFNLSLEDLDYLCSQLISLNREIEIKFNCLIGDELKKQYILFTFISVKNLVPHTFLNFYALCKKYYPNLTFNEFCSDVDISPIWIYLNKIIRLYLIQDYSNAKMIFDRLASVCIVTPLQINFKYKKFYLWYLLIKYRMWFVFDILMKIYCKLK